LNFATVIQQQFREMQPSDFDKVVPERSIRCISAGPGWDNADPNYDSPYTFDVDGIYYIPVNKIATKLVSFYTWIYDVGVCDSIDRKRDVCREIYAGARKYWYRHFHREYYQKAIAQWVQRDLDLPGEVAKLISELT
jgi:hypothetical protein